MSTAIQTKATPPGEQIYKAMSAVMAEIGAVGKTRKNTQQGYSFRGVEDVVAAIKDALVQNGVFYVPDVLDERREERTTAKGAVLIYTTLRVRFTFYAADGSAVSAVVVGEGMDSGDKSANKAMSSAQKYALTQVFNIPTMGADSEEDSHEVQPRRKPSLTSDGEIVDDPHGQIRSQAMADVVARIKHLRLLNVPGFEGKTEVLEDVRAWSGLHDLRGLADLSESDLTAYANHLDEIIMLKQSAATASAAFDEAVPANPTLDQMKADVQDLWNTATERGIDASDLADLLERKTGSRSIAGVQSTAEAVEALKALTAKLKKAK